MIHLACDYLEGCLPEILKRLKETNLAPQNGYGLDEYSENARRLIREACQAPDARVFFLDGGTQCNTVVIHSILRSWEGVICPESGHISVHEAGAIESRGHEVIALPQKEGKITAAQVAGWIHAFNIDDSRDHCTHPGMVYISQPTEWGTLYSKAELEALSRACHENGLPLYVDGARLAYALASEENDVSLPELARLADVFYIGGTKCGGLLGEALVVTNRDIMPHFFTLQKQQGALLAKGRITGITFEVLMSGDNYLRAGRNGTGLAQKIQDALVKKGCELYFRSPTNQIFAILPDDVYQRVSEKAQVYVWQKLPGGRRLCRFCCSWATKPEDIDTVIAQI